MKKQRKHRNHGGTRKPVPNAVSRVSIGRFLLTYVVLMGGFFLLISLEPLKRILDVNGLYTDAVVHVTVKSLGLIGIAAGVNGSIIVLPNISLNILFGCNGLEAVLMYAVAVISFPASWRQRFAGILGGFLVIQALNILRIVGLAYAGVYHRELFEILHVYVAQGIMIAVALAVFLFYLVYVEPRPTRTA